MIEIIFILHKNYSDDRNQYESYLLSMYNQIPDYCSSNFLFIKSCCKNDLTCIDNFHIKYGYSLFLNLKIMKIT